MIRGITTQQFRQLISVNRLSNSWLMSPKIAAEIISILEAQKFPPHLLAFACKLMETDLRFTRKEKRWYLDITGL